jgi:cell division protein FtsL
VSPAAAARALLRGGATVHAPGRARTRPQRAPARRRSGATAAPRAKARARTATRAQRDYLALLDRLLLGPAYIALVGVLLAGIVFFNVGVLQLNHGIAGTDARTTDLERQNAQLTQQLAKLASSERIQRLAIEQGLVLPQPGDVHYLRANPGDAGRALRVMTAPDSSSAAPATSSLVSQTSTAPPGTQPATPAQAVTEAAPPTTTTTTTPVTTTPTTTTSTPSAATAATP